MLNLKEKISLNTLKTLDETDKIFGILKCLSKYCPIRNKEMYALLNVLFEKNSLIRKRMSDTAAMLDKE